MFFGSKIYNKMEGASSNFGARRRRLPPFIVVLSMLAAIILAATFIIQPQFSFPISADFVGHESRNNETQGNGEFCTWDNCPKWSQNGLNVHLICHTHDDMGWLKTEDDYYTGANAQIYNVGVQYILSTVVAELAKDPSRRFSYAEVGFLTKWLEDKSPGEVEMLRKLVVERGQMEFIGGGWTQPDEATTHYVDLIDQYSLGLGKLAEKYGKCGIPKVAWQIDPFGHSIEHTNLVSLMGFEGLFFARMHYAELEQRARNKSLEMEWKLGEGGRAMFTSTFLRGTYGQPDGFCFDTVCGEFEPIVDNPEMDGYNVERKLSQFLEVVWLQMKAQRHNHVLISMGNDFTYSNAAIWFANLDRLIRAANKISAQTNVRLFYSTPSCYLKALQQLNASAVQFPQRDGDFFPYASHGDAYWTGYFSSKPAFKGLIRRSSAILQLTRQFDVFAGKNNSKEMEKLERAQALVTHHDAVTGTSKEAVTQNYEKRIFGGWDAAEKILSDSVNWLAKNGSEKNLEIEWKMCRRINETFCEESMGNGRQFAVTILNGNGRKFKGPIRIPVNEGNAKVFGADGKLVHSKIIPSFWPASQQINNNLFSPAQFELIFNAKIDPIGFGTFFVEKTKKRKKRQNSMPKEEGGKNGKIENEFIRIHFGQNGRPNSLEDLRRGEIFEFSQQFVDYSGGTSGAYLFRLGQNQSAFEFEGEIKLEFVKNEFVEEARQRIGPLISQVIRLYPGKIFAEFEFLVGPLPRDENKLMAHEVATRYSLGAIESKGTFWTDSNGRRMVERRRNQNDWFEFEETNPVVANYYPINSRIWVNDSRSQMTVLTDRSQGGTSLRDGQLEIMVHRRCFQDDGLGVGENLDEPGENGGGLIVRGKHWLHVGPPSPLHRQLGLELFHQPILVFSNFSGQIQEFGGQFKVFCPFLRIAAKCEFVDPEKIGEWPNFDADGEYFGGEGKPGNGQNQFEGEFGGIFEFNLEFNLKELFKQKTIEKVEEMSLAGNFHRAPGKIEENVLLGPMQIRTFKISLK